MTTNWFEIRVCTSCGLRYPLVEGHPFGLRCPGCLGETRRVLKRELSLEPPTPRETETGRRTNFAVLLDNVRSAWNVGSILRSADGFGFTHAYLCGITPTADHEAVRKTSLGAEESVPWSYHKDAVRLVRGLQAEGWKVYALEEEENALDLSDAASLTDNTELKVLIVGNEVTGVDPELLGMCDQVFSIRMRGAKKSFNVASAFGIAAYALHMQEVNNEQ